MSRVLRLETRARFQTSASADIVLPVRRAAEGTLSADTLSCDISRMLCAKRGKNGKHREKKEGETVKERECNEDEGCVLWITRTDTW